MTLTVRALGPAERLGDWLMHPAMRFVSGTLREGTQQTHRWNNEYLTEEDITYLDHSMIVSAQGDPAATKRWLLGVIPLFHMPIFGGWRQYRVVEPVDYNGVWYIGWIPKDAPPGLSLLPTEGGVRVLEGPGPCRWFGVTKDGTQIALCEVGVGHTGKGGPFAHIPLR